MNNIKKNLINIKSSSTLAINEASNQLQKEGKEIYKFGLGQSPFPVPSSLVNELKKRAHEKDYLNVSGLLELRKQIAKYHSKKNKNKYLFDNVIVGPGSKELIFQIQLVLNGDLLLPNPSWVSYEPQAKILQKKIYWINANAKSNWHITAKEFDLICKKSKNKNKLLILNSPNNPSGTIHKNLKSIAKVAKKNNVIILSDEIYCELDFSGKYKSISHFYPEGTIISSGISKWCGAGGWRLGALIFPKELVNIKNILRNIVSETFTSVSAPIQFAAVKAYSQDHSKYLSASRLILEAIGNYIFIELTAIGVKCQKPQGGFYMLCDFSKVIEENNKILNSKMLCDKLLRETGFAMLPGSDFGINEKLLISRIAFVDFDGKKALLYAKGKRNLSYSLLKRICPKIVRGIEKLKKWIREIDN
tara:strand:- start:430 stop:1683 length:1254 start_codon:yes stop_codon:yes gene_type:complete